MALCDWSATIGCVAFPLGSSEDKIFEDVTSQNGLDYTLDIMTDFDVEFFGCEQIFPDAIPYRLQLVCVLIPSLVGKTWEIL